MLDYYKLRDYTVQVDNPQWHILYVFILQWWFRSTFADANLKYYFLNRQKLLYVIILALVQILVRLFPR